MDWTQLDTIAFDFDDTLLYGVNSEAIQRFILENPHKTYLIVTHRTPAQAATIPAELEQHSDLRIEMFARVMACPERTVMEFGEDTKMRRAAGMSMLSATTPITEMFPGERKFVYWKGYVCQRLGAKVLVDDLPQLSKPGCDRYHVQFVNSRDPLPIFALAEADDRQKKKNALALFKRQYNDLLNIDVTKASRAELVKKYIVELKAKNLAEEERDYYATQGKTVLNSDPRMNQQTINQIVAELKPLDNPVIIKKINDLAQARQKAESELDQLMASRKISRVG